MIVSPSFVVFLCGPGRKISSPIRMFVALVWKEVVLLGRERDSLVVNSFQITRWRRVNSVNFTSGRLFRIYMSTNDMRLSSESIVLV